MKLRIGTRGSALARAQTSWVAERLREATGAEVELVIIKTRGDELQSEAVGPSTSLGVGLFTKALELALERRECELAVHSLKDLPCDIAAGFTIAAVPPREDVRDALCSATGCGLAELPQGARVGTGSPRRVAFLKARRPDLELIPIRGNIDTRLGRLRGEDALDAVVLAVSGLKRAGLGDAISEPLDLLPAPGQGALGIECLAERPEVADLIARIDDAPSRRGAELERRLHLAMGGGCLAPLGARAEVCGEEVALEAMIASLDGATVLRAQAAGASDEAVVREVAAALRGQGAEAVLEDARRALE